MRLDLENPDLHQWKSACQPEDQIFVCTGRNLGISWNGSQPIPGVYIGLAVGVDAAIVRAGQRSGFPVFVLTFA